MYMAVPSPNPPDANLECPFLSPPGISNCLRYLSNLTSRIRDNREMDKGDNHLCIDLDSDSPSRTGVRKSQWVASHDGDDDKGFACSALSSSKHRSAGITNLKEHRLSNYDKTFARSNIRKNEGQAKEISGCMVITTVLLTASLLSAFLIHSLGQMYSYLRGNGPQLSAAALVDISNQLHGISLNQAIPATTVPLVDRGSSMIPLTGTTIPQWLVSLALLLGAAVTGIVAKQRLFRYLG